MHRNMALLERLYNSLNQHDAGAMANCYRQDATFHDIAFDLHGRDRIGAMWRMICSGDIAASFEIVSANDKEGVVKLVDEYTFSETGRRVRNAIESRFQFDDGLILKHVDFCDARSWAASALGGIPGFVAGRFRFVRAWKAQSMLRPYLTVKRLAKT